MFSTKTMTALTIQLEDPSKGKQIWIEFLLLNRKGNISLCQKKWC